MTAFSVNFIWVGADQFTAADRVTVDRATGFLRGVYATVGLSLRRVEHYGISTAQADGRDVIANQADAEALTEEWTIPNDAIDVFIVRLYVGGTSGLSPTGGPCDKDALGMNGAVVELAGSYTGQVLAHEVGHYLGLAHVRLDVTNLMFPTVPNGATLTSSQGATMRSHCFVGP